MFKLVLPIVSCSMLLQVCTFAQESEPFEKPELVALAWAQPADIRDISKIHFWNVKGKQISATLKAELNPITQQKVARQSPVYFLSLPVDNLWNACAERKNMGFTVYYQSTEPVSDEVVSAIAESLDDLCEGRTWLSCEPVGFFGGGNEACLIGGSKPNFDPHPEDIAEAKAEGMPDGTLRDVVQILCQLSSQFGVDWQFGHDHDPGPIGFIRGGVADAELENQIVGIMSLHSVPGNDNYSQDRRWSGQAYRTGNESTDAPSDSDSNDDDDDGPRILKFGPID